MRPGPQTSIETPPKLCSLVAALCLERNVVTKPIGRFIGLLFKTFEHIDGMQKRTEKSNKVIQKKLSTNLNKDKTKMKDERSKMKLNYAGCIIEFNYSSHFSDRHYKK